MKHIKRTRGFTLIELLVVITIIGLLASLAVPAIGKALENAKQTADISNGRQLGIILFAIANDDNGNYPGHADDITDRKAATNTRTLFNSMLKNKELPDAKLLISKGGTVSTSEYKGSLSNPTLAASNVGWDYVSGLTTGSNASIPLVVTKKAVQGNADVFGADISLSGNTTSPWGEKGFVVYTVGNSASWQSAKTGKTVSKLFDGTDVAEAAGKTVLSTE